MFQKEHVMLHGRVHLMTENKSYQPAFAIKKFMQSVTILIQASWLLFHTMHMYFKNLSPLTLYYLRVTYSLYSV